MFEFRDGSLNAESVPLEAIAREFGTPCFVYSRAALAAALRQFQAACGGHDVLVCYAMKANSNLAILNLFAGMGAGFDVVSGGELARVVAAGGDCGKVIFSGVGKTAAEMRYALESGILCFNVESPAELARLADAAGVMGRRHLNRRTSATFENEQRRPCRQKSPAWSDSGWIGLNRFRLSPLHLRPKYCISRCR